MSDSRSRILAKLRERQPEPPPLPVEEATREHVDWTPAECVQRFSEKMTAVRAEVHPCSKSEWPQRLRSLCRERGLRQLAYGPGGPLANAIEQAWAGQEGLPVLVPFDREIETWKEPLFFATDAGITSTLGGIARTGSLVLWPTPQEPRTLSLVPPLHIAVLDAASIAPTFAELIENNSWAADMPANALLISGPSKTADIEQTLAYGIHGPTDLLVLLLE